MENKFKLYHDDQPNEVADRIESILKNFGIKFEDVTPNGSETLEYKVVKNAEENTEEDETRSIADLLLDSLKTDVLKNRDIKMLNEISRLEERNDIHSLKKAVSDFKKGFSLTVNWHPKTIIVTNVVEKVLKELNTEILRLEKYQHYIGVDKDSTEEIKEDQVLDAINQYDVLKIINKKMTENAEQ